MAMLQVWDAHCHLSLADKPARVIAGRHFAICGAIVNGTHPGDWPKPSALTSVNVNEVVFMAGLHPWAINAQRHSDWRELLVDLIGRGLPGIGEIGLDGGQTKNNVSMTEQMTVFQWQINLACRHNLPVSIHAVRANAALLDCLKAMALPERGIHLHDFYAPLTVMRQLQQLADVWFSFGPRSLLRGNKDWIEQVLPTILPSRLLFETDLLHESDDDRNPVKWPEAFIKMAQSRKVSLEELTATVNKNTREYFL
jgi:TatD DNase family protein